MLQSERTGLLPWVLWGRVYKSRKCQSTKHFGYDGGEGRSRGCLWGGGVVGRTIQRMGLWSWETKLLHRGRGGH